jgi:hypothetical protein
MADETMAIAPIPLARDARRVLALPALLALVALALIGAGVLLPDLAPLVRAGLIAGGAAVLLLALVLAAAPLTLRVEVEVGGVRTAWLLGSQRYHLSRGAVTRVALSGPSAGTIHSRFPFLGWSMGRATLRGDEPITLVRVARTPSVILVPTELGRLAIAPASERDLLEALAAAARVQQRLDEVSGRVMAAFDGVAEARAALARAMEGEEAVQGEADSRFLTGIERARLEERLAAAREAALLAAEAERQAAVAGEAAHVAAPIPAAAPRSRFGLRRRRAYEPEPEAPITEPSAARQRVRATWTRPRWATDARLATLATIGWAAVPLIASLGVWALGGASVLVSGQGTSPRLMSLGLALGGPGAALGVVATRSWWPRLTGLVATSGLAGLALVLRALGG